MSTRKLFLLLNEPIQRGMQRNWMGRPMYFQTASRLLKEETTTAGLGKPSGVKKTKGLAKTDWNRPQQGSSRPSNNQTQGGARKVAPRRDWSKPVDQHVEKHAGETYKTHERHVNKFSKPPPKRTETQAQKRERKKREEELNALAREEEKERQQISVRKAKQKAKEQAQNNQMKDVYIPEIINVANLSRVLGVRIGKKKKRKEFLFMH